MSNICPFMLRTSNVYLDAIGCAYALVQTAFHCFFQALKRPQGNLIWMLLVSTVSAQAKLDSSRDLPRLFRYPPG
jgi:hypothetical protein